VFERKIFRKMFGPTKEDNGNWRIKTKLRIGLVNKTPEHNKLC
jgi:hypothetical protein